MDVKSFTDNTESLSPFCSFDNVDELNIGRIKSMAGIPDAAEIKFHYVDKETGNHEFCFSYLGKDMLCRVPAKRVHIYMT